jgi:folylpolyglutamate synthase
MSQRSYSDAVLHLTTVQSMEDAKNTWVEAGKPPKSYIISETVENLRRMGYAVGMRLPVLSVLLMLYALQQEDLNSLNVIHVAGTKGKGSTCALTDSILRRIMPGGKTGA